MDYDEKHEGDLERTLESLTVGDASKNVAYGAPYQGVDVRFSRPQHLSTPIKAMSTNQMLENLTAATVDGNRKLDMVTHGITELCRQMEMLNSSIGRQNEFLAMIARNTSTGSTHTRDVTRVSLQRPGVAKRDFTVKDCGFNSPMDVASALLTHIFELATSKVKSAGIDYRSPRKMQRTTLCSIMRRVAAATVKNGDEVMGAVELPENKDDATLQVAERLGSLRGFVQTVNAASIATMIDDTQLRAFMNAFYTIVEKLRCVSWVLPYYESDLIRAMSWPFFNAEGELMYNYAMMVARKETDQEKAIFELGTKKKERLIEMVTSGVPLHIALRAVSGVDP